MEYGRVGKGYWSSNEISLEGMLADFFLEFSPESWTIKYLGITTFMYGTLQNVLIPGWLLRAKH